MRISENCESFQWRESFCDAAGQSRLLAISTLLSCCAACPPSGYLRSRSCSICFQTASPNGIPTPGRRTPPRQAIELGVVPDLRRRASTHLEASLRLAAQEYDEIRPLAGFG